MKRLILLPLMVLALLAAAQTDSLELKLQQYKSLFEKGLITGAEYQSLREKELKLTLKQEEKKDSARQHNFNVRIAPVFYGAVWSNQKDPYYSTSGKVTNTYEGGVHIEAGPVIKKQQHLNVAIGFEGGQRRFQLPVYAHYHINFMQTKASPYLHLGFGYVLVRYIYINNADLNYNGFVAPVGIGANFKLSRKMDMALSADYRLLCIVQQSTRAIIQNPEGGIVYNSYRFLHELGGRLQFIFH